MDFSDLQMAYALGAGSPVTTLYIITTVLFGVGTLVMFRLVRTSDLHAFPQNVILFAFVTGLIFRAISLGAAVHPPTDVTTMFTSFDYARLVFFTLCSLAIHVLPLATVHTHIMHRKSHSLWSFGLSGQVIVAYLWSVVTLGVMIALAVVASNTPAPALVDVDRNLNQYMPPRNAYYALTGTYIMIWWWFIVSYATISLGYSNYIRHWSMHVYMMLLGSSQIGSTISFFFKANNMDWLILQYVFALIITFPALLIATRFGSDWITPLRPSPGQYPLEERA